MKTKLLFICTANLDRSPCAESLFENSEKYEASSAGIGLLTENPVTKEIIDWADEIFVMEYEHKVLLREKFGDIDKDVVVLGVSNEFCRYDEELEKVLRINLEKEEVL
ncbi:MAG: protein tyrosine phosphatase [Nanoarchaeota archaeon]|nr:protein tyrosine phosphatase [Nanoarchaeota archaeon]